MSTLGRADGLRSWLRVRIDARRPSRRGWLPLNGQRGRRAIVAEIVERLRPTVVVETGTHRGITARHLHRIARVPVHTIEADADNHRRSARRLRRERGATVHLGDSRAVLRRLTTELPPDEPVLFYLDAHWGDDLPLAEELAIIEGAWTAWIAVVDDFEVPDDDAYGYDRYPSGAALTVEYLVAAGIRPERLRFPVLRGEQESGARRGCVALASPAAEAIIDAVTTLRPSAGHDAPGQPPRRGD